MFQFFIGNNLFILFEKLEYVKIFIKKYYLFFCGSLIQLVKLAVSKV